MGDEERLEACQDAIGYTFENVDFLDRALTHSSAKAEARVSNQRLEFLGDSVLGLVVSELLYSDFPKLNEGRMTKVKAEAVSGQTLELVARELDLARYMRVGKMFAAPEEITGSVLADCVEAIIAAIFLDGGLEPAEDFIYDTLEEHVRELTEKPGSADSKSLLGQWAQKACGVNPEYSVESMSGPDHALTFEITVSIGGDVLATASGPSKKAAEQEAARLALEAIDADA